MATSPTLLPDDPLANIGNDTARWHDGWFSNLHAVEIAAGVFFADVFTVNTITAADLEVTNNLTVANTTTTNDLEVTNNLTANGVTTVNDLTANDVNTTNLTAVDVNTTNLVAVDVNTTNLTATDVNTTNLTATEVNTANLVAVDVNTTNLTTTEVNTVEVNTTNLVAVDVNTVNLTASGAITGPNVTTGNDPGHLHTIYLNKDGSVPLTGDWTTGAFSIIGSDHWYVRGASKRIYFGAADNGAIYHNAVNLVIEAQEAGVGNISIPSGAIGLGVLPAADTKLYVKQVTSLTTSTVRGIISLVVYGSAGSGNNANGLIGTWNYVQTGGAYNGNIAGNVIGAGLEAHHYGTGSLNQMYGDRIIVSTRNGSGTIGNAFGVSITVKKYVGGGAFTSIYGLDIADVVDGSTYNYAIYTRAGQVRIGDDLFFADAGSGLPYAGIYGNDLTATITITGTGTANKVQVLVFDTNDDSNLMTPDHTDDHITTVKAGIYFVAVNIHTESVGGAAYVMKYAVYKNNGATASSLQAHRHYSGGGSDCQSTALSGFVTLAATDTLELWCWNETNTANIIVEDVSLSAVMVGG